ncbi:hypothetical protein Taro_001779 [Colocasia esculenta]|uniref:Uncharacterized protein n=1 Tax=Colocasia esculenta TaxID=4460 RepID=A0A843TIX1_COLES|nr:hypothetical protein [Colocasia esculenta]
MELHRSADVAIPVEQRWRSWCVGDPGGARASIKGPEVLLPGGQEKKLIEVLKNHEKFFQMQDKVWLFNSRLSLFSGKLKSRQDGLYSVVEACDNGAIILDPKTRQSFIANGQRLKHFFESPLFLKTDSTKLAEPNEA